MLVAAASSPVCWWAAVRVVVTRGGARVVSVGGTWGRPGLVGPGQNRPHLWQSMPVRVSRERVVEGEAIAIVVDAMDGVLCFG